MPITTYVWNPLTDNVVKEKDGAGQTTAVYTHEPGLYGKLISQRRNGQSYQYHFDGQGSTRQLTDESQNVTDEYTYTAFGETVVKSGTTENPYRFVGSLGYYSRSSVGDIYIRMRTYAPNIARWISPDPMRFSDSVNAFAYALNSPVSYNDPSGTETALDLKLRPVKPEKSVEVKCGGRVCQAIYYYAPVFRAIGGYGLLIEPEDIIKHRYGGVVFRSKKFGTTVFSAFNLLCRAYTVTRYKQCCTSLFGLREYYVCYDRVKYIEFLKALNPDDSTAKGDYVDIKPGESVPILIPHLSVGANKYLFPIVETESNRASAEFACNEPAVLIKTSSATGGEPVSGANPYYWWIDKFWLPHDPPENECLGGYSC